MSRRLEDALRAAAVAHPDRTAVVDADRGTSVTYGELDRLSDRLASTLEGAGVEDGDRVGLCLPKTVAAVVALFGALKARAVYVPVDVSAPMERTRYILSDCGVRAVVTTAGHSASLRAGGDGFEELGPLDGLGTPDTALVLTGGPGAGTGGDGANPGTGEGGPGGSDAEATDDLAYILYTSGSTGAPKGVVHTHASGQSFVDWCVATFDPTPEDRFSSHAPFHFDLSILDLFVPLGRGASVVLFGEGLGKFPVRLAPAMAENGITVWYSTPSVLRLLLEYGELERFEWDALRLVLFAGEVFPIRPLRELRRLWQRPRFFNLYGPTETNVCTFHEIPGAIPVDRDEPYPIGRACANDRTAVLDDGMRRVARGEEGELCVAGGSVMLGYWNLPERSAGAFHVDGDGTRWYRTGDVVREDESGDYAFLGRRDRMVKRRGYRIELGEVEAALYAHEAVREAAVVATPSREGDVSIVAFLDWATRERPTLVELKGYCARRLPAYMIPDRFEFRAGLPKTSTDKIDYQRLAREPG